MIPHFIASWQLWFHTKHSITHTHIHTKRQSVRDNTPHALGWGTVLFCLPIILPSFPVVLIILFPHFLSLHHVSTPPLFCIQHTLNVIGNLSLSLSLTNISISCSSLKNHIWWNCRFMSLKMRKIISTLLTCHLAPSPKSALLQILNFFCPLICLLAKKNYFI